MEQFNSSKKVGKNKQSSCFHYFGFKKCDLFTSGMSEIGELYQINKKISYRAERDLE